MTDQTKELTYEEIDFTQSDILAEEIIVWVRWYMQDVPENIVRDMVMGAYVFAREAHSTQRRKSGDPYINHPLEATKLLLDVKPDLVTIQSCILHDVIEDTERTEDDIRERFGDDVARICQGLSKLSAIKYRWEERTVGSLRKMLIAMVDDLRVIIVKLADRLHNMRTLDFHPNPAKRERIALETLNIYAPIADRLGIFWLKEQLETECFRILHPEDYAHITEELSVLRDEQKFFLSQVNDMMREIIDPKIPVVDISYRIKSPYSIYKKITRKRIEYKNVGDLYDLFAVRIITDNIRHCYEILGILHNVFTPMPKRFKDYIALPKENGYQSLHTTVVGLFPDLRSQPTEVQIRTEAMHKQAEVGIAAHFTYSESGKSKISNESYWVSTIKEIVDENKENGDFMTDMKVNVFSDQIFVFTPKWDVITLPKGSTPIDFAYNIHSNIGNTLAIAKVNGQVVPLDYALHNGESVSIITDKNRRPRPIWLSFVATSKAREHIRQYINREERDFFVEKWRNILDSYLKKYYGKWLDKELSLLKNVDGNILDTKGKEDILVQLGNLSRKPISILKSIHDDIIREQLGEKIVDDAVPEKKDKSEKKKIKEGDIHESANIIIGQERDIPYRIAQCCEPTAHDEKIIGIIGQGSVTIHKLDCPNVEKVDLDRRIPTRWDIYTEKESVTFTFECTFLDRKWILMELTQIFYSLGLNIKTFATTEKGAGFAINRFTLETESDDYYIYERLEAKILFSMTDVTEMKLLEMH